MTLANAVTHPSCRCRRRALDADAAAVPALRKEVPRVPGDSADRADLDALNTINVRAALEWFRGRASRGTRGGQVSTAAFVNTLKTLASFMEAEEIYTDSPLRKLRRVRVPKVLRTPFSPTELVALWGACRLSSFPARDEALLLLLLDTGVRIGEAVTLTLDKVQLDQGQLIVGLEGKGRRERIAPIGDPSKRGGGRAIQAIRRYLDRRPESARSANRLFLGRDGFPLSADAGAEVTPK
jgi:site-specific recombinase XerD